MRIIIYSQHVKKVNGVQTFEKIFCKKFRSLHEITYVYEIGDPGTLEEFSKLVRVEQNKGQTFQGDIAIYSSLNRSSVKIEAPSKLQVVHCVYDEWKINYKPKPGITHHIAVGDSVEEFLDKIGIECYKIQNMLDEPTEEKVLRFLTASRIAEGKGFDRMLKLCQRLKAHNRRFVWEVYGEGTERFKSQIQYEFSKIPEIKLMGARTNIQAYMKGVDYVVQLSDSEGYCYSIHEALQVGVPVIVTNWKEVENSVDDNKNGFIVDMELSNVNEEFLDKIYNEKPKDARLINDTNSEQLWIDLFNILENK